MMKLYDIYNTYGLYLYNYADNSRVLNVPKDNTKIKYNYIKHIEAIVVGLICFN